MKITIELASGPNGNKTVTKSEIQKNIDVLDRAIQGRMKCSDDQSLSDTKSIIEGIQENLPVY